MRKIRMTYGRGIARKATRTKKCTCGNPRWYHWQLEVNDRTDELTYTIGCHSCDALWSTKSREARMYWEADMDKRPERWECFVNDEGKTVREMFEELDRNRLSHLEAVARSADAAVVEAQSEAEKAHKAVEKFKKMMEEL